MASSFTTNKGLEKPGNGDYVDTWNVPVNADMDVIDKALGGVTSLNATGGSATLTASQYQSLSISVTGSISAPATYTIPSGIGGQWIIRNTTTDSSGGPHAIVVASGGGGTSLSIPRGSTTHFYSDGTNIRLAYDVTSSGIADNAITSAKIVDGAITYPKINSSAISTASDFRSDEPSKVIPVSAVWDAAEYVSVSYSATITLDFSSGFNFSIAQTGNLTLANPLNAKPGQSGIISLAQDASGGRSVTLGSNFKTANGVVPSFDTAASRLNILAYTVVSGSFIVVSVLPGVR